MDGKETEKTNVRQFQALRGAFAPNAPLDPPVMREGDGACVRFGDITGQKSVTVPPPPPPLRERELWVDRNLPWICCAKFDPLTLFGLCRSNVIGQELTYSTSVFQKVWWTEGALRQVITYKAHQAVKENVKTMT